MRAAYFVLALAMVIGACEKPEDSLGLGLIPDESLLGLSTFTDSTSLVTTTILADSTRTNELNKALLGDLFLPDYGTSRAEIYTQVRLSGLSVDLTGGGAAENVGLDSLVLSLEYLPADSLFGPPEPLSISVMRLTEDLELDSVYYSDDSTPSDGVELLLDPSPITPDPTDSVSLDGLMYPPQLRLRLIDALGEEFITKALEEPSVFDAVDDFMDDFKGLHITASNAGVTGCIAAFDLLSPQSRLTLYYHNEEEEGLSFEFDINGSAQRYEHFAHDHQGGALASLNEPLAQDVYIQSMAGLNVNVDLPILHDLTDSIQGAFNKVELVLPVSSPSENEVFAFPRRLFAVYTDETGDVLSIPDIFEGDLHSDGYYDADKGEYRVNITRFAQRVGNGQISTSSLQLLPVSNAITSHAVRLRSANNISGGAKLVVTYTQYE